MLDVNVKKKDQKLIRAAREKMMKNPVLRHLFLELTLRCNEKCLHCGSSCGDVLSNEIGVEQYDKFLHEVADDFDIKKFMLNITGGEPLLRKDFFEIMEIANKLGYNWGMTSNATLITHDVAKDLAKVGMKTISVSIDGLKDTHDNFRRTPGGWDKALQGVQNLIDTKAFNHIQITTVVTHQNISELPELYKLLDIIDIDSWRIIEMDPIGRALQHPELLLTKNDIKTMAEFIRNMRLKGEPVVYGCSHYLGLDYEHEIRDWYFMCLAGIGVASICCNGDIVSCLDIERRPEFIQGNIKTDRFKDIWENKFKEFRINLDERNTKCSECEHKDNCHGGSFHTWDFDKNEQRVCFKDALF